MVGDLLFQELRFRNRRTAGGSTNVNYRTLGQTGLKVSELSLGTMTFGDNFFNIAVVDQTGANRMVARALEAGINFFDTADVYAFGQSETLLGEAPTFVSSL